MNRLLLIGAVLVTSLLTVVCQVSAAAPFDPFGLVPGLFTWYLPTTCEGRLEIASHEFKHRIEQYDRAAWFKYLDVVAKSSGKNDYTQLSLYAGLLGTVPAELKNQMLIELARRRRIGTDNKRNIDLMFNLLNRGDIILNDPNLPGPEAAYRRYFEHEAKYFAPAYDPSVVFSLLKAIQKALPEGSSVAVGGSVPNVRSNLGRGEWDLDLLGELSLTQMKQVKLAVESECKAQSLKLPRKVDFHQFPRVYFEQLNVVHFDVHGGEGSIEMVISAPPLPIPSESGYHGWDWPGPAKRVPLK